MPLQFAMPAGQGSGGLGGMQVHPGPDPTLLVALLDALLDAPPAAPPLPPAPLELDAAPPPEPPALVDVDSPPPQPKAVAATKAITVPIV